MSDKLTMLLRRILREEIRTELAMFKKEILSEIRRGSSAVQPITEQPTRKTPPVTMQRKPQVREVQRPKPKYSDNPMLQSLLEDTEPLYNPVSKDELIQAMRGNLVEDISGGFESDFDDDLDQILKPSRSTTTTAHIIPKDSGISSIVTEDTSGAPVNTRNPTVKNVLDILNNTDYRTKLKVMDEAAKNFRQTGS